MAIILKKTILHSGNRYFGPTEVFKHLISHLAVGSEFTSLELVKFAAKVFEGNFKHVDKLTKEEKIDSNLANHTLRTLSDKGFLSKGDFVKKFQIYTLVRLTEGVKSINYGESDTRKFRILNDYSAPSNQPQIELVTNKMSPIKQIPINSSPKIALATMTVSLEERFLELLRSNMENTQEMLEIAKKIGKSVPMEQFTNDELVGELTRRITAPQS